MSAAAARPPRSTICQSALPGARSVGVPSGTPPIAPTAATMRTTLGPAIPAGAQ